MNASIRFLIWSPIPLGALLGGWLGEVVGLRTTLWTGALGATLAVLWLLLSPVRELREG